MSLSPALLGFQRIKYAAYTSLLSKATTLLLQLLAVPIALRWLGADRYAVYLIGINGLAWIGVFNLGLPQALAIALPSAMAAESEEREAEIFQATLSLAAGVLGVSCVAAWLSRTFMLPHAVGQAHFLTVVILVNFFHGSLCVVEACQAGHQELHLYNLLQAIGSLVTWGAVLCAATLRPSIVLIAVTLNGVPLLPRFVNAIVFLWGHSRLITRRVRSSFSRCWGLVLAGCSYFLVGLGSYMLHQYSVAQIGRFASSGETALFASAMTFYTMGFGVVSMITVPMTPAVALHAALDDMQWICLAKRSVLRMGLCYGACALLGLSLSGPFFFYHWLHGVIRPSNLFCSILGCYFVLCVTEHIYYQFIIGIGGTWFSAFVFALRAGLVAICLPRVGAVHGLIGVLVLLCLSVMMFTLPSFIVYWKKEFTAKTCLRGAVPITPQIAKSEEASPCA